nr:hypothetical protein GCM10020092_029390 [Actinoplanes digitatis]
MPDDLIGVDYYDPTDHGAERAVGERLPRLRRIVRGPSYQGPPPLGGSGSPSGGAGSSPGGIGSPSGGAGSSPGRSGSPSGGASSSPGGIGSPSGGAGSSPGASGSPSGESKANGPSAERARGERQRRSRWRGPAVSRRGADRPDDDADQREQAGKSRRLFGRG